MPESQQPAARSNCPPFSAPIDPAGSESRRRILLVEDHRDTAIVVQLILEQRGFEVLSAASCAAAWAIASESSIDLLICDIALPDGSGIDLIRRLQLERSLPAIAVSGFGTTDDVKRSLDAGFAEHLTKPFGMHRLIAAVERAMA